MFGRLKLLFGGFLIAGLCGCAQPKYEIVQVVSDGTSTQNQKVSECKTRFKNSNLCLIWQWQKMPTTQEAGVITYKIVRANTLDDSPLAVNIPGIASLVLWMPSMGHGSSPSVVTPVDTGSYRATEVFFIMPGEWELHFQFKEGSTVSDEAVVTLTI